MNEKEFITKAIEHIDRKWNGIIPNYDAVEEWLDEYLAQFHREYHDLKFQPRLRRLNMVEDRTDEQRIADGDLEPPIIGTPRLGFPAMACRDCSGKGRQLVAVTDNGETFFLCLQCLSKTHPNAM